jgi:SAM-dependent methyltransferase
MLQRLNCPICGARAEIIFSRPYARPEFQPLVDRGSLKKVVEDKPYEIRYCAQSDLYFQTWVMEDHELSGWYSPPAEAQTFLSEISKQKLHWLAHMTEEILVLRQLCPAPLPKVLDFGCNWGKWASMALAHGCDVYAVEVNRDAAAFCASRGIPILTLDQLCEHRFDFINVDQVMEHLSDPLGIAKRLSEALRPGGLMKFSTPDNPALGPRLARAQKDGSNDVLDLKTLDALLPFEHVNLYNHRSLKFLAEAVGLRSFQLPFFKWLGAGQLWNIPRQLNRNLVTPFKRWRGNTTYQWFQKPN